MDWANQSNTVALSLTGGLNHHGNGVALDVEVIRRGYDWTKYEMKDVFNFISSLPTKIIYLHFLIHSYIFLFQNVHVTLFSVYLYCHI